MSELEKCQTCGNPKWDDRECGYSSLNCGEKKHKRERLRDEFAVAALTGMLASPAVVEGVEFGKNGRMSMAHVAYEYADAMLEARK